MSEPRFHTAILDADDEIVDADLAHAANAALARTAILPPGSVTAEAHDRHITLGGEVNWEHQRRAACNAVGKLAGQAVVCDAIVVTPQIAVSTAETTARVNAALAHHPEIHADRIGVAVNGDEIILTGEVSNSEERIHAENAAWAAPGAACVLNLLTVAPKRPSSPWNAPL